MFLQPYTFLAYSFFKLLSGSNHALFLFANYTALLNSAVLENLSDVIKLSDRWFGHGFKSKGTTQRNDTRG